MAKYLIWLKKTLARQSAVPVQMQSAATPGRRDTERGSVNSLVAAIAASALLAVTAVTLLPVTARTDARSAWLQASQGYLGAALNITATSWGGEFVRLNPSTVSLLRKLADRYKFSSGLPTCLAIAVVEQDAAFDSTPGFELSYLPLPSAGPPQYAIGEPGAQCTGTHLDAVFEAARVALTTDETKLRQTSRMRRIYVVAALNEPTYPITFASRVVW